MLQNLLVHLLYASDPPDSTTYLRKHTQNKIDALDHLSQHQPKPKNNVLKYLHIFQRGVSPGILHPTPLNINLASLLVSLKKDSGIKKDTFPLCLLPFYT